MKKSIALSLILLFITLVSCKKDKSSSSSTISVSSIVAQGKWKVTFYENSGTNETSNFNGYEFLFNSNGTVSATKSSTVINGNWSDGNDDSQLKLVLTFSVSPFSDLNDDWHIIEKSSTVIKLEDVSGGNGGTDYLTFEKI